MTRLALAQRAHLAGELSAHGLVVRSLIVADDENLEIAREFGCATVEMDNSDLGARFNAGFRYAGREGADWLVHVGSDDWIHPDLFDPLLEPARPKMTRPTITGRQIAFVDLARGLLQPCIARGKYGVIPWMFPREVLERVQFEPIMPGKLRGIDGHLVRGLREGRVKPSWLFHDPHPLARVDFKSSVNITPYGAIGAIAHGPECDPWSALTEHYPADLVQMARDTAEQLRRPAGGTGGDR